MAFMVSVEIVVILWALEACFEIFAINSSWVLAFASNPHDSPMSLHLNDGIIIHDLTILKFLNK